MYCSQCGHELPENAVHCPWCGAAAAQPELHPEPQPASADHPVRTARPWNLLCILGFSLACASILIPLEGLTPVAGLVLSILGLVNCHPDREQGRGLAIAGIVIIGAGFLFYLLLFFWLFGSLTAGIFEFLDLVTWDDFRILIPWELL